MILTPTGHHVVIRDRVSSTFKLLVRVSSIVLALTGFGYAGSLVKQTIDSQGLAGNLIGESPRRTISVYLPDGYENSDQRYPTVYWFPGYGLGPTQQIDLTAIDTAMQSGQVPPALIVFMPVHARFGTSLYWSSEVFGDWERHLTAEVIPWVDATYRTHATPRTRGVMGFSAGGFTALTLPVLQPGVWGAIGVNDPSTWAVAGAIRDREDYPPGAESNFELFDESLRALPEDLSGFTSTDAITQVFGQVAAKITPNPNRPVMVDFPKDSSAEWLPQIRDRWRAFDWTDPAVIATHATAFRQLSVISLIHAATDTNRFWSQQLVDSLATIGIEARSVVDAGGHSDFHSDRFLALLEDVTRGMTRGDFDLDGDVDIQDVDALSREILAATNDLRFDLTADARVNGDDLAVWVKNVKKSWIGDANLDMEFNSGDLVAVFQVGQYENPGAGRATWSTGDWNADGIFTTADFVAAFQDGGYEQGPRIGVVVVPEPSIGWLAVGGGIGSMILRIRRIGQAGIVEKRLKTT